MIDSFDGKYRYLSNFFIDTIVHENMEFRSVEHAYQASKTLDPLMRRGIQLLQSPSSAKSVGNAIVCRPDWETIKVDVMRNLLAYKFRPGSSLAEQLKATYPEPLTEGNRWHDNFWGVCRCPRCPGTGQNMLGQLLQWRRAELRAGIE